MRFAVGVPNVRDYADPRLLIDLARRAERAGWDGFFVWDHLVYHHQGDAVVDPWVVVSAVGAVTERLRFGVMMCALPRRRPWKVAREAASLDRLSGGRLAFGAAIGSLPESEFAAFGEDPQDRARAERLDEALEILRGLWSGKPFAYRGRHFTVAETVFVPAPVQRPLPIWVGGQWPNRAPFRRGARWEGIFPTHREVGQTETMSPLQLREIVDYTLSHREGSGPFDVVMEGQSPIDSGEAGAFVRRYAEAGLTWWVERLGWFRGSVDQMYRRIEAGPPS